jgi:hypothetical protein
MAQRVAAYQGPEGWHVGEPGKREPAEVRWQTAEATGLETDAGERFIALRESDDALHVSDHDTEDAWAAGSAGEDLPRV